MIQVLFTWRRASPLCRDLTSHLAGLFLYRILFRLHERKASVPRQDLAIQYPRTRLGGLEISHVNAIKRANPPRRAGGNNRFSV